MFNEELKKEVQGVLKEKYEDYRITIENTVKHSEALYQKKLEAIKILGKMSKYIENLAGKPIEYETKIDKIELNLKEFNERIKKINKEKETKGNETSKLIAGIAGITTLGSTTALAISTNATLASLGGGALAVGGAGMAAGETLLALAGPIGWTIGGVALASSGLLLSNKNKEDVKKMEEQILEIKKQTMNLMKIDIKILFSEKEIVEISEKIENQLKNNRNINDYNYLTKTEKENLRVLVNVSEVLSKKIGEIITNE